MRWNWKIGATLAVILGVAACSSDDGGTSGGGQDVGVVDAGGSDSGASGEDATASADAQTSAGDGAAMSADAGAGGADAQTAEPDAGSADAGSPAPKFASLTKAEKKAFMQDKVMPTMKGLFVAYDATRFGDMNCGTCHGADAQANGYKMPAVFALDPANMPQMNSPNAKAAKAATFMHKEVVPTMRALLGADPFDPGTGKGFGCFSCHQTK